MISIIGATEHNLKNINVDFPLGLLIAVTGVSGSGKSTLINDILHKVLSNKTVRTHYRPGAYKKIVGAELIDKVICVDQSPIGRTPRSNPATYTGVFSPIRDLFAQLPESKARGTSPDASASTFAGADASIAKATVLSASRCSSCRMSTLSVNSAAETDTTAKRSKSSITGRTSHRCCK